MSNTQFWHVDTTRWVRTSLRLTRAQYSPLGFPPSHAGDRPSAGIDTTQGSGNPGSLLRGAIDGGLRHLLGLPRRLDAGLLALFVINPRVAVGLRPWLIMSVAKEWDQSGATRVHDQARAWVLGEL
jgi:hypothetical protein